MAAEIIKKLDLLRNEEISHYDNDDGETNLDDIDYNPLDNTNVQKEIWVPVPIERILRSRGRLDKLEKIKMKYEVSSLGRVRNTNGYIMKYQKDNNNRKSVSIVPFGPIPLLRLMAFGFKLDEIKKFETHNIVWHADHIDEDCTNDTLYNLAVISASENSIKSNINRKNKRKSFKPVIQKNIITGEIIREFSGVNEAQKITGISRVSIRRCHDGKYNHAGGFKWEYKNLNLQNEIWYDCKMKEYKGLKWSNFGRICTISNIITYGNKTSRGYYVTRVFNQIVFVHKIIASECYPREYEQCKIRCKIGQFPEVDHIDRNPQNNRPENLRWVTKKENVQNRLVSTTKAVTGIHIQTQKIFHFKSIGDACRILKLSDTDIIRCCKNPGCTTNGHLWKYNTDEITITRLLLNYNNGMYDNISKAVSCINISTSEITTYKSIKEASLATNCKSSDIVTCCKGKNKSNKNYIWRYKREEYLLTTLRKKFLTPKKIIRVTALCIETTKVFTWESIQDASKQIQCNLQSIKTCYKGKQMTCEGYIWKITDGNDKDLYERYNNLISIPNIKIKRQVCRISKITNEITVYKTIMNAKNDSGFGYIKLYKCLKQNIQCDPNYIWKFKYSDDEITDFVYKQTYGYERPK